MSDEKWHGTKGGYNNHRCRCARCREAHRVYMKAYFERNPEQREKRRIRERARWHRKFPNMPYRRPLDRPLFLEVTTVASSIT